MQQSIGKSMAVVSAMRIFSKGTHIFRFEGMVLTNALGISRDGERRIPADAASILKSKSTAP
jgi:hypothetical protein